MNRIDISKREFSASSADVYAALVQMLDFSINFDIQSRSDAESIVYFTARDCDEICEARVIPQGISSSAVVIAAPLGNTDITSTCDRLYQELREQINAQTAVARQSSDSQAVAREQFLRALLQDNAGPRSKLATLSLVVSVMCVLIAFAAFSSDEPEWGGILAMLICSLGCALAAIYVTGPKGKVSGRRIAVGAFVLGVVAVAIMFIATLVVQIRYSTSGAQEITEIMTLLIAVS